MSIVKVVEVISEGNSVDEAIKSAIQEASKTVSNICQVNVEHIAAIVEDNTVTKFRVNSKISFVIEHE